MKENKGITLIALIITILVMLILVAVVINILINSRLIDTTKRATTSWKTAQSADERVGTDIEVGGKKYASVEDVAKAKEIPKDKNGTTIEQTTTTKPFIPDNNTEITNNSLETGLTIRDNNQNNWVWIEVPTNIYDNSAYNTQTTTADMKPANSEDYEKIRYCLEEYTKTLIPTGNSIENQRPSGWKDYWYYWPVSTTVYSKDPLDDNSKYKNGIETEEDISSYLTLTDGQLGTGLTYEQYKTKYKAMLKSVYENGGFYIGQYETGYEGNIVRNYPNGAEYFDENEDYPTVQSAVIKKNAYPYNYVTISQAESLSEGLATGRKKYKFNVWSTMGFSSKALKCKRCIG